MKRERSERKPFEPPPVRRIELSGEHSGLRIALFFALLALGMFAFGWALKGWLSAEPGWTVIEASSAESCAADFRLEYRLGSESATLERRQLSVLYTEAAERAYRVFHATRAFDGVGNVCAVNAHPNETVAVEPELYAAFELIEAHGSRALYLAPVYAVYDSVFRSADDAEAAVYDPARSKEVAAYVAEALPFVNDPSSVSLELLGGGRVRLRVSEGYLRFAAENGIDAYLDFYWLKNAFITDTIADMLREKGFTNGFLSSKDGFACNLDESGEAYALRVFDRQGSTVRLAATVETSKPVRAVGLHNYPASAGGAGDYYYEYENGEIRTPYLDPADGRQKSALNDLLAYSYERRCAEILLGVLPLYVADRFDASAADALAEAGVYTVYGTDGALRCSDPEAELEEVR